jgi:hypothetical protein
MRIGPGISWRDAMSKSIHWGNIASDSEPYPSNRLDCDKQNDGHVF